MIRVQQQPEPTDFGDRVREPGRRFLALNPHPSARALAARPYWRRAAKQLHHAYEGICAYTCHWIAIDTGWRTVEHFVPKSVDSDLAYEWSNFRLVCGRLNSRKGSHRDVLDPFVIHSGVFFIEFPTLLIKRSAGLSSDIDARAQNTIDRLRLNDETCINARLAWVRPYCAGDIGLQYLRSHAPFIHQEIQRQDLLPPRICDRMGIWPDP